MNAEEKPKRTPKKSTAEKKVAKTEKKPAAKSKKTQQKDIYAIIRTGGKQYCVRENDLIDVELLREDQGEKVEFREVLFVNDGTPRIGEPHVAGSIVKGEVVDGAAGPKVVSLKYRPRQHSVRKFGHRQHYSRVKITEIAVG